MGTKFWRLTVKGERSADEIQAAVGGSAGSILRIHFEGDETDVYLAAEGSAAKGAAKALRGGAPKPISASRLTRLD
jgi:hypothetical protein